jgi:hypothetical protein
MLNDKMCIEICACPHLCSFTLSCGDARMIIVMMLVSAMPAAGAMVDIVIAYQRHTPFHSVGPALTPALLDPHDATAINIS